MPTDFPRGSEWRRWDLHIHTPCSIVQRYGGDTPEAWNRYIAALAALPSDIAVVAVTDYLFIDGYKKLLARRHEIPNIKEILPNIEFRLNTFAGTDGHTKKHNFHVIFDSSVPPDVIQEQFLNCLSTAYRITDKSQWHQTPTRTSLAQLGQQIKATAPGDPSVQNKTDLQLGFESITYDRSKIMELLAKDPFVGKYVIGIGYSEWEQSRWNQSAATKRDLINNAHFALTANQDTTKAHGYSEQLRNDQLNDLVLHSSDAHRLEDLGTTQLWLRADPTFAGLKQVINARDRVHLGSEAPSLKAGQDVIDCVTIDGSSNWFDRPFEPTTIPLNDGLVAIIGGKGSGKSALAEMIAAGAGAADGSDDSFTSKAIRHDDSIEGTTVSLKWQDGSSGPVQTLPIEPAAWPRVRYLPQKAVEELCSPTNNSALIAQIESVLFQALPESARGGASSFDALKDGVLERFRSDRGRLTSEIEELNQDEAEGAQALSQREGKRKRLEELKHQITKLKTELPQLPAADQAAQNRLASLYTRKQIFERVLGQIRQLKDQHGTLLAAVERAEQEVHRITQRLESDARALELSNPELFRPAFSLAGALAAVRQRIQDLEARTEALRNGEVPEADAALVAPIDGFVPHNYAALMQKIASEEQQTKTFETTKLRYQQQQTRIAELQSTAEALDQELAKIDNTIKPAMTRARHDRKQRLVEALALVERERHELSSLYEPLQGQLLGRTETFRRLQFEAELAYDVQAHANAGLALLDRTKRGNFRDSDNLSKALRKMWDTWRRAEFSEASIRAGLDDLFRAFTNYEKDGASEELTIEGQLRTGFTRKDFFDWMFSIEHIRVSAALKFDGTDLYLLSPGQKGIVLLMLYLGLDRSDRRPLIIDQPEDNLDNWSVCQDLIGLFRERKRERQIVIVTHNPNLVVNTDADQVIVASFHGGNQPRLDYQSGSLENLASGAGEHEPNGILERVCDVLEGGPKPFGSRSKVYALSPKLS